MSEPLAPEVALLGERVRELEQENVRLRHEIETFRHSYEILNLRTVLHFRADGGKAGRTILLHTTGAKTGAERITPLGMSEYDGRRFVFAANAGADEHPDWYFNLLAQPGVTVEHNGEVFEATAVPLEGADYDDIRSRQVGGMFDQHQARTTRILPIVELIEKR